VAGWKHPMTMREIMEAEDPALALQRERKGLSEELLNDFADEIGFTSWSEWDGGHFTQMWYDFARKIEAAHGIQSPEGGEHDR
jgi:hypothetical protein